MEKDDKVERQSFEGKRFEVSDEFQKVLDECQGEDRLPKLAAHMVKFFDGSLYLKDFIDDHIEVATQGYITKNEVYKLYKKYRKEKELPKLSKNEFNIWIKKNLPVTESKLRVGWRNKEIWQGIRLIRTP